MNCSFRCATWSGFSAGSPISKAKAKSRCAGWSRKPSGCGPDRLVVGEVREAESLDMLIALEFSGLPGMCTVHANSAHDAVTKICTLPLLAGDNISSAFVVPTVASCIDLVVHCSRHANGRRQVTEILSLGRRVENGIIESSMIFSTDRRPAAAEGQLDAGGGEIRQSRLRRRGTPGAALMAAAAGGAGRSRTVPHLVVGLGRARDVPSVSRGRSRLHDLLLVCRH